MILRNGKRLISCDEEQNKKKRKKNNRAKFAKIDENSSRPYLHEELIFENILIRLSAKDLAICSCVSKFWYNSILKDSKFGSSHFARNKNRLNLVFNFLNVVIFKKRERAFFFSLEEEVNQRKRKKKKSKNDKFRLKIRLLTGLSYKGTNELVGRCNGLVCMKRVTSATHYKGGISVVNPARGDALALTFLTPASTGGPCIFLCNGFGFDSLSGEYKVVFIYTTTTISGDQKFICLVLTLGGTYARREIVISMYQIPASPGSSPFPSSVVTTCRVAAATLYGGDLVWWITNTTPSNNDKIDMLLSFDIHNEKVHFIRLPTECSPTPSMTLSDEHQCLVVDHHLLEFEGDLCVARTEKIMIRNNGHHCHHRHRRHYRRHHCNGQRRSFCCCGFKVHLFILKDKVNQVWIKVETFDIQIKEEGLLPAPFCCYFDTNTTTTTPPTRILNFSGHLLLYWFDGEYLLLYNLQLKHLKVVKCSSSCNKQNRDIFESKMEKGIRPGGCVEDDDNSFLPYMDYQLHAQAENILSLKTFIPEGETRKFNTFSDFQWYHTNGGKEFAGVVVTHRELVKIHPFY